MDCPVCHKAMNPIHARDLSIDECPQCRGLWFDKGELEAFKDEVDPDLRFLDFEIWSPKALVNFYEEPLACPRCRIVSMRAIKYLEPDLVVTCCPSCEGVWLNFGDFKDIVEAFRAEAEAKSVPEYVHSSLKEASDILMNPQDLISEWKDLKAVLRMLRHRVFVENPEIRNVLVGIQKSLPL